MGADCSAHDQATKVGEGAYAHARSLMMQPKLGLREQQGQLGRLIATPEREPKLARSRL